MTSAALYPSGRPGPSTAGKPESPYPATIATPPRPSSPQEGEQNEM
jgi:hypothetical protein